MNQALMNDQPVDCDSVVDAGEQICLSLAKHHHVFLFMDYDGILSERSPVPSADTLDPEIKSALKRLSLEKQITIAMFSGRSVPDLADRVGLPIIYGGDHGLEIHGSDFEHLVPGADAARLQLPAICNEIRKTIQHIPGALVEAKRLTASVHYRQVSPDDVPALERAVNKCVDPVRFEVRDGRYVLEIRPRLNWSKVDAAGWILRKSRARAEQSICIGGDEADEDMLLSVPRGINIRTGDSTAVAPGGTHCIQRTEVASFLGAILDIIHGLQGTRFECNGYSNEYVKGMRRPSGARP
jgi:trehalose 6-phosphate phosphatase